MISEGDVPSYQGLIDHAAEVLQDASETPRIDAEILLQHAAQQSMAWLIARGQQLANYEHSKTFFKLLEQRQQGVPVAYIIGHRDFWTIRLAVDERVLIPRPDTETLVELALSKLAKSSAPNLLDLGTGSGAIALSLAKERPYAHMLAVDSQADALELAKQNALNNRVSNVDFLLSDWFEQIDPDKPFDLIASNPPYVQAGDPHLANGDLRFEPDSALIAEENGLADLKSIIASAPAYLASNGWLVVEHGYDQADQVKSLFAQNDFFNIELHHDINQLPRCTIGQHAGAAEG